jgi:hypothetical protein
MLQDLRNNKNLEYNKLYNELRNKYIYDWYNVSNFD